VRKRKIGGVDDFAMTRVLHGWKIGPFFSGMKEFVNE
jgi:hypothetical protein